VIKILWQELQKEILSGVPIVWAILFGTLILQAEHLSPRMILTANPSFDFLSLSYVV